MKSLILLNPTIHINMSIQNYIIKNKTHGQYCTFLALIHYNSDITVTYYVSKLVNKPLQCIIDAIKYTINF